jgi:hypothetical protein
VIFALPRNEKGLLALASADEAAARCKGIDVRAAKWLFFSEDGSPLEARFEPVAPQGKAKAKAKASPDVYTLRRAMSGLWLQERLERIDRVEGCGLSTLPQLVELLKINRGKRAAAGM